MLPLSSSVIDFLTLPENNQQGGAPHLEFNALALLLKDFKDSYQKSLTFICAGSEDLDALLAKLCLDENNPEAFILIRPYIHSMGLYFRYAQGEVNCFLFDSQNWGLRYYPTRNILKVISKHYPNIHILLSAYELQPQNYNMGCNELTLLFLESCAKNGIVLFEECQLLLNPSSHKEDYQCAWLKDNQLPQALSALPTYGNKENEGQEPLPKKQKLNPEELINRQINLLLTKFNTLFIKNYASDNNAISQVIDEMQGLTLQPFTFTHQTLYPISVQKDKNKCQLTIKFRDKDHFKHNNLFLYNPSALFPGDNDRKCNIFDKIDGLTLLSCEESYKIILQANKARTLLKAINSFETLEAKKFLNENYRHQRLAFLTCLHDIKNQFEIMVIKKKGMGFDQVNKALKYFLRNDKEIYVYTDILNLTDQNLTLPSIIKNSRAQNYFVISLGLYANQDTPHQIALIVNQKEGQILLIDSLNKKYADNPIIKELSKDYKINYQLSKTAQPPNTADCGLHVIENVCAFFKLDILPIYHENFIYQCLDAWHKQIAAYALVEAQLQYNLTVKSNILDIAQQFSTLWNADKNPEENSFLQTVIALLNEELYVDNPLTKVKPTEEWQRTRSLQHLVRLLRPQKKISKEVIILFESLIPLETKNLLAPKSMRTFVNLKSPLNQIIKFYFSLFLHGYCYLQSIDDNQILDLKTFLGTELELGLALKELPPPDRLKVLSTTLEGIITGQQWGNLGDGIANLKTYLELKKEDNTLTQAQTYMFTRIDKIIYQQSWGITDNTITAQINFFKDIEEYKNVIGKGSFLHFLAICLCMEQIRHHEEALIVEKSIKQNDQYRIEQEQKATTLARISDQQKQHIQNTLASVGLGEQVIGAFFLFHRNDTRFYSFYKSFTPQFWSFAVHIYQEPSALFERITAALDAAEEEEEEVDSPKVHLYFKLDKEKLVDDLAVHFAQEILELSEFNYFMYHLDEKKIHKVLNHIDIAKIIVTPQDWENLCRYFSQSHGNPPAYDEVILLIFKHIAQKNIQSQGQVTNIVLGRCLDYMTKYLALHFLKCFSDMTLQKILPTYNDLSAMYDQKVYPVVYEALICQLSSTHLCMLTSSTEIMLEIISMFPGERVDYLEKLGRNHLQTLVKSKLCLLQVLEHGVFAEEFYFSLTFLKLLGAPYIRDLFNESDPYENLAEFDDASFLCSFSTNILQALYNTSYKLIELSNKLETKVFYLICHKLTPNFIKGLFNLKTLLSDSAKTDCGHYRILLSCWSGTELFKDERPNFIKYLLSIYRWGDDGSSKNIRINLASLFNLIKLNANTFQLWLPEETKFNHIVKKFFKYQPPLSPDSPDFILFSYYRNKSNYNFSDYGKGSNFLFDLFSLLAGKNFSQAVKIYKTLQVKCSQHKYPLLQTLIEFYIKTKAAPEEIALPLRDAIKTVDLSPLEFFDNIQKDHHLDFLLHELKAFLSSQEKNKNDEPSNFLVTTKSL